jgi:type II secretory pathway component GspD/PulD (secretin)
MMALEHPRLLAASLIGLFLATSCSTPPETTTPASSPPTAPAASTPTQEPQQPQQPQERVSDERRRALVAKYLSNAQGLRSNGNLEAAKRELLKAKELSPTNEEVLTLLRSVQAELGEPPGRASTYAEEQLRLRQIGDERALANVQAQLQKAQQMMADKNYAGAVDELRVAQLAITAKKDDMDWKDLPSQVEKARVEAEKLYDEQRQQSQAKQNEEAAEQLRRQYAETEARRAARLEALLHEAQIAFQNRAFQRAQDLTSSAMQIDPNNAIAYELHTAAVKAGREGATDDYHAQRARHIRAMIEADEDLKIPQTSVLEMDMVTWQRAEGRSRARTQAAIMDPQDEAVWAKVRTDQVGKLSYTEETGAFLDVIKNLNLITGVTIITTPAAREIINTESLKVVIELVSSMTLKDFLNHMVGRSQNLAWTVKNGVVVVGNKSEAAGTIQSEIYPVKDLIFKETQFLPPRIRDIPGDTADDTPRTGSEGEDPVAGIELADLVNTLKDATDPKYWETEGVEVRPEESGLLSVKASPEMQALVRSTLDDMRRFSTPIITIDSKFLTISRNFLQEIGVDIRGLGGSGNKGQTVSLDDVTNGLQNNASRGLDNGGTGDPAANPLAGAFYNDGGDGDIRGRTENFFTSDLGRVLSPTGGLTAGWTLLDDTQLQVILRAVEKKAEGEVVNSQILSVRNKGRGHVAVINQTSYVRDFDVEVAQAAFIADPKVDVIQDGIVLDVQPVILNDRKYIILNLNPTVAELERPIPTFTTSLAGSTLPVTLQLPKLTVTNFWTTVKVPDGGSVLLGGLRQVLTKERRAEIPFLTTLPLISFLFKQEGIVDENRSLMVMVRAQITDVHVADARR